MNKTFSSLLAIGALAASHSAFANTAYSNPADGSGRGDCLFEVACGTDAYPGTDTFAAQAFTLSSVTVINGGDFTELDYGSSKAAQNITWGFLQNDGAGGLPGTILASGVDSITSDTAGSGYRTLGFSLGTVALGPGTYYFAFQVDGGPFTNFLAWGAAESGAATSQDGGVTWVANYSPYGSGYYGGESSVAIDLFTAAPEPAAWAMMLVGVGLVGGVARRKLARA